MVPEVEIQPGFLEAVQYHGCWCWQYLPVEVKGLSQPLSLQWDGVEGPCQLMVLTTLTDVDVILGMDVLSQFGIRIDFKKQTASPAQEYCTSLIQEENIKIPATWDEIQKEFCDVLGETDPKDRAIEGLLKYKPKDIGLGGIAADIIAKAARATDDVDMQARLGLKSFLQVVPESTGRELRRKHFQSVWEALLEAKFLQKVQDNENLEAGKVLNVGKEEEKPKENKVDLEHVVCECLKQLQAQANLTSKNEQPGKAVRGKGRCWCCGEEGHVMMQCPTVKRNRAALSEATRPKRSKNKMAPDGVRGCQMVPEGAIGADRDVRGPCIG